MRKSAVASCVIISGLLVFCVVTLVAVYGTRWESPVVLLEETFAGFDGEKWTQEVTECRPEGDHFRYYKTGAGLTAEDGVLHVHHPASEGLKVRREAATGECSSCSNCSSPLFSARIRSRDVFDARIGRLEVRARFRTGERMRFRIGLVSNESEPREGDSKWFSEKSHFEVVFESAVERTVLRSWIPDEDFHSYELDWSPEGIALSVDHSKVDGTSRDDGRSRPAAPFHVTLGADLGGRLLEHPDDGGFNGTGGGQPNGDFIQLDYVKLFRGATFS